MRHGVKGGPRRNKPIRPKKANIVNLPQKEKKPVPREEVVEVIIISPEIDYDNLADNGPHTLEDDIKELPFVDIKPKPKKKKRKYTKRSSYWNR